MPTEHAQMHAGVKGEKSENPEGKGEIGKWEKGGVKNINSFLINCLN